MDTGNIMENQLQDQYDGWENEQIEEAKKRQHAIADRILSRMKPKFKIGDIVEILVDDKDLCFNMGEKVKIIDKEIQYGVQVYLVAETYDSFDGVVATSYMEADQIKHL